MASVLRLVASLGSDDKTEQPKTNVELFSSSFLSICEREISGCLRADLGGCWEWMDEDGS